MICGTKKRILFQWTTLIYLELDCHAPVFLLYSLIFQISVFIAFTRVEYLVFKSTRETKHHPCGFTTKIMFSKYFSTWFMHNKFNHLSYIVLPHLQSADKTYGVHYSLMMCMVLSNQISFVNRSHAPHVAASAIYSLRRTTVQISK